MEEQNVFSLEKELGRLSTQNQLMLRCEEPIFRELFAGKTGLRVLDVGCNDGEKTVRWFSKPEVARVVGVEFNASLARRAQEMYGGETFGFYPCNVEAEDFSTQLRDIVRREGGTGFDVIYLSFLLSHLKAPEKLLRLLRPLLREGGVLVAVDSNDSNGALAPEGGELFRAYLDFLAQDPYGGNRGVGVRLPQLLRENGYRDATVRCDGLRAGPGERELKEQIFETYSFLTEDMPILRKEWPEEPRYRQMEQWLEENYTRMKRCFVAEDSRVTLGITVVTCAAGTDTDSVREERGAET